MNGFVAVGIPGAVEILVVILVWAISAVIPILVVLWFARKTLENKRENMRLRLEVGKLADELERVRKQQQKG